MSMCLLLCALQVHQSLLGAFKACLKLSCRSSGNSNLQLELAMLGLLQAIRGLGVEQALSAAKVAAMSSKLSEAAAELLQETWEGPEEEAAEGDKGNHRIPVIEGGLVGAGLCTAGGCSARY